METRTAATRNVRLRRAREARNWTQANVARAIGTSNLTISRWELGVQQPVPYFREKLCALFGMSPQELGLIPETISPRELPLPPADFVGRADELARLRELLDPGAREAGTPVVIGAVDGMGGIGKSALAIHAAHQLVDAGGFPDGQLYVNLRGATPGLPPLEPRDALGRMLRSLGLDSAAIPGDVDEAAARFRSLTAERRLLVLLDDARSAEQVRPLLPGSPTCGVLVTSRQVLATLPGARSLHLDVLSPEQALGLLGRIAGAERLAAEPDAAAEVVRCCGRLPLAVRIAGARLAARPGWPVQELAAGLADAARRLEALRSAELAVHASFDVSLHALEESPDPADQAAAAAFGLLSLPDGADLGLATAVRLLDQPEADVHALLERLVDAQLLESPRPGRYGFHDLVRLYAREHAGRRRTAAERSAALTRALRFFVATTWRTAGLLRQTAWRVAPADPRWGDGGLQFEDTPAALGWLDAERANLLAAVAQAARDALGGPPALPVEVAGQLASALAGFFERRSYWHDQVVVNLAALEVARRTRDRAGQAIALNDLGLAQDQLGRYAEAGVSLREGLALFRELGDRHGQADGLFNLGLNHLWLGGHADAMACLRRSLAVFQELGDRAAQATSLSTLGSIHARLAQYEEATACLRQSLVISREQGDRLGEAAALTNLGGVARHLGRGDEAIACLRDSLRIFREFGHRGQASTLHDLGLAYGHVGRQREAVDCMEEAFLLFQQFGNRRGQAMVLRDLGDALRATGHDARAREVWQEGLAVCEGMLIPEADELRLRLAPPAGPSCSVSSVARPPPASPGSASGESRA